MGAGQTSGSPGTVIIIQGPGFGATQGANTVTLGGTPMTILQWSDNQILVSVAAGASSGPVLVMVNNAPSNGIDFSVSPQPAPVKSEWTAIALLSLAAGAHQGWSANLFTTSSDMFARSAVGAVVGAFFAGHILQLTHSYAILFAIAASAYLLALLILHLLAPGLKKVEFTA